MGTQPNPSSDFRGPILSAEYPDYLRISSGEVVRMNLQLFVTKKGGGSTKNGRDHCCGLAAP